MSTHDAANAPDRAPRPDLPSQLPTSLATPAAMTALVAAIVLTGLSAGFFLTYTTSVTRGLALVDDVAWLTTFQAINETVRTPVFMVVFAGPVPAAALAMFLVRERRAARWLLATAVVAQLVVVVTTFAGNVSLNERLADVPALADAAAAARGWFEQPWNQLNLVRTVSSVIAATSAATAAVVDRARPRSEQV